MESKDAVFGCPCDCCKKLVCKNCTKLSSTEMRTVVLSSRFMLFYCPQCLVSIQELPKLKLQMSELRNEVEKLKESVNTKLSYADALKNVEQETRSIKGELENVKTRFSETENAAKTSQGVESSINIEPAIAEMQERERRACNLLLFGFKESKEENREKRQAEERQAVTTLIGHLSERLPVEHIKLHRLGRFSKDKVRPVRVIFPSKEEALRVLRARKNLPQQDVYIKYDQTPSQREFLRGLVAELKRRQQCGEENLRIKYIGGIPRIIRQRATETAPKN